MNEAKNVERAASLRRFKPYLQYKDSGVEWLGEIPAHWKITALKRIGDLQGGAGFPEDEQGVQSEGIPFFKVGDMGSGGNEREMICCSNTVSEATARRLRAFIFPPRTIVFAKVGAALLLNRRRLLTQPSCIDNNMMGFMPETCDYVWAFYWLSGLDLRELANPGAVPSVNEGQMRGTPVAVPPEPEQSAIAAFLDRETARMDALVAKKERLIELLQEKRTALITHAVTKGLDPSVPMKNSGVEWLGEIPAHWDVKRLKHIASIRNSKFADKPEHVPYLGLEHIESWTGRLLMDAQPETVESVVGSFMSGDVLFGKLRPYLAKVARPDFDGVCTSELIVMEPTPRMCAQEYLSYCLLSPLFIRWINSLTYGTKMPRVSPDQVSGSAMPLPPDAEQRAIAAFLDGETARIDSLVAKVREAIDHLKELRTALISAAVTGKIDVREEAA